MTGWREEPATNAVSAKMKSECGSHQAAIEGDEQSEASPTGGRAGAGEKQSAPVQLRACRQPTTQRDINHAWNDLFEVPAMVLAL